LRVERRTPILYEARLAGQEVRMAPAIAGWTFGGVWLTATLWAVLDAEARGRNPVVWGFLTFFFGPFALGAYAITGGRETASEDARRRTYFSTASFFFLGVVYASLVALIAVALDSDESRIATAILLAVLFFGLPLWAFHWFQALAYLERSHGEREDRAAFLLFRRYGAVVLIISGLVAVGFGIYVMFTFFAAIMGVFEGGRDSFLPVSAFLPLTGLLIAYHWLSIFGSKHYRALAARFDPSVPAAPPGPPASSAAPDPPAPDPPPAPAEDAGRFCHRCGARAQPGDGFCGACGQQLRS
jgi:hypothetical protein